MCSCSTLYTGSCNEELGPPPGLLQGNLCLGGCSLVIGWRRRFQSNHGLGGRSLVIGWRRRSRSEHGLRGRSLVIGWRRNLQLVSIALLAATNKAKDQNHGNKNDADDNGGFDRSRLTLEPGGKLWKKIKVANCGWLLKRCVIFYTGETCIDLRV